jgi:uncharacterized protein involved in exopolysaccharide biosynthesis
MREIELHLLLDRALKGWRATLALAMAGMLFVLVTLPFKTPMYRVMMSVSPTPTSQGNMQSESGGNSLGALLSLGGGGGASSDYTHYQVMLTSTAVAQRLADKYGMLQIIFADQWDARAQSWHPPRSTLTGSLKEPLVRLANIRPWNPPDATALAAFLKKNLLVTPSTQNDIVEIQMDTGDVAFGRRLMLLAHKEANNLLGEQVARHASQEAAYLEKKLAQTAVTDYRSTLLSLLSQQEKTIMLTQTDASYAAEILDQPIASPTPVSPRPVLSLFVAALVGAILGLLLSIFFGPDWWRTLLRRIGRMLAALRAGRYGDALPALWG